MLVTELMNVGDGEDEASTLFPRGGAGARARRQPLSEAANDNSNGGGGYRFSEGGAEAGFTRTTKENIYGFATNDREGDLDGKRSVASAPRPFFKAQSWHIPDAFLARHRATGASGLTASASATTAAPSTSFPGSGAAIAMAGGPAGASLLSHRHRPPRFPLSRRVLWDRTSCGDPLDLSPAVSALIPHALPISLTHTHTLSLSFKQIADPPTTAHTCSLLPCFLRIWPRSSSLRPAHF